MIFWHTQKLAQQKVTVSDKLSLSDLTKTPGILLCSAVTAFISTMLLLLIIKFINKLFFNQRLEFFTHWYMPFTPNFKTPIFFLSHLIQQEGEDGHKYKKPSSAVTVQYLLSSVWMFVNQRVYHGTGNLVYTSESVEMLHNPHPLPSFFVFLL